MKVIGENRFISADKNQVSFNSNRFFLSTIARVNDIVEFDDLKVKIISISTSGDFPIDIKSYRKKLFQEISDKYPEKLKLIEAIEDDLLTLGLS